MLSKKLVRLLALLLWGVFILCAIYIAHERRLSLFDPTNSLLTQVSAMNFSQPFSQAIGDSQGSLANKVIHFSENNCVCQRIANSHISSVKHLAQQEKFENIDMSLTAALRKYIPSTPAVAVFDHNENLIYFGPYSSGYFCSVGSGIVEKFLTVKPRQKHIGAVVLTDSKGCYCSST